MAPRLIGFTQDFAAEFGDASFVFTDIVGLKRECPSGAGTRGIARNQWNRPAFRVDAYAHAAAVECYTVFMLKIELKAQTLDVELLGPFGIGNTVIEVLNSGNHGMEISQIL